MSILNILITIIAILISVAFYTLLERKILGYIQIRKGPNKTSAIGLLQPISDALKLFNKSLVITTPSNFNLTLLGPSMAMIFAILTLSFLPYSLNPHIDNHMNILTLILISSLSVYPLLLTGWATNSKYSNIGSIRSVAQMISYEVNLFMIILSMILIFHSYNLMTNHAPNLWLLLGSLWIFSLWVISALAEVNRSPFDFAEGESELVSGFNVEYMSAPFALIFLAEYTNMIVISVLTAMLFSFNSPMLMITFTLLFLWIRGALPRFRFDLLMKLNWKIILPLIIMLLIPNTNLITWSY